MARRGDISMQYTTGDDPESGACSHCLQRECCVYDAALNAHVCERCGFVSESNPVSMTVELEQHHDGTQRRPGRFVSVHASTILTTVQAAARSKSFHNVATDADSSRKVPAETAAIALPEFI